MNWYSVSDQNPAAMALYRRHYSKHQYKDGRRHVGGVMPPGEHMFLMTTDGRAIFGWLRNLVERYDKQAGVNCTVFRNEGSVLSSELIREAMELAWQRWPNERLWTYVEGEKITSPNPGYCFQVAGWSKCGRNKDGRLTILEVLPTSEVTPAAKLSGTPARMRGRMSDD